MSKSANVLRLHPYPTKCHKKTTTKVTMLHPLDSYSSSTEPASAPSCSTRTGCPASCENLWITKHIRMPHCTVHSGFDVVDDLVWVGRLSGPLLLNNNLLVGRDMTRMGISCVVRNGRRGVHNRM